MRQLALTDDEVFERQQVRKLAKRDDPTPVAVLPAASCCGEGVFWRVRLRPGKFGPCRQQGRRAHDDLDVREVTTRPGP